jgi:hypothetical protein
MHTKFAETLSSESSVKLGISAEKAAATIDRRLAVAPMMDWTDDLQTSFQIR